MSDDQPAAPAPPEPKRKPTLLTTVFKVVAFVALGVFGAAILAFGTCVLVLTLK